MTQEDDQTQTREELLQGHGAFSDSDIPEQIKQERQEQSGTWSECLQSLFTAAYKLQEREGETAWEYNAQQLASVVSEEVDVIDSDRITNAMFRARDEYDFSDGENE